MGNAHYKPWLRKTKQELAERKTLAAAVPLAEALTGSVKVLNECRVEIRVGQGTGSAGMQADKQMTVPGLYIGNRTERQYSHAELIGFVEAFGADGTFSYEGSISDMVCILEYYRRESGSFFSTLHGEGARGITETNKAVRGWRKKMLELGVQQIGAVSGNLAVVFLDKINSLMRLVGTGRVISANEDYDRRIIAGVGIATALNLISSLVHLLDAERLETLKRLCSTDIEGIHEYMRARKVLQLNLATHARAHAANAASCAERRRGSGGEVKLQRVKEQERWREAYQMMARAGFPEGHGMCIEQYENREEREISLEEDTTKPNVWFSCWDPRPGTWQKAEADEWHADLKMPWNGLSAREPIIMPEQQKRTAGEETEYVKREFPGLYRLAHMHVLSAEEKRGREWKMGLRRLMHEGVPPEKIKACLAAGVRKAEDIKRIHESRATRHDDIMQVLMQTEKKTGIDADRNTKPVPMARWGYKPAKEENAADGNGEETNNSKTENGKKRIQKRLEILRHAKENQVRGIDRRALHRLLTETGFTVVSAKGGGGHLRVKYDGELARDENGRPVIIVRKASGGLPYGHVAGTISKLIGYLERKL